MGWLMVARKDEQSSDPDDAMWAALGLPVSTVPHPGDAGLPVIQIDGVDDHQAATQIEAQLDSDLPGWRDAYDVIEAS